MTQTSFLGKGHSPAKKKKRRKEVYVCQICKEDKVSYFEDMKTWVCAACGEPDRRKREK